MAPPGGWPCAASGSLPRLAAGVQVSAAALRSAARAIEVARHAPKLRFLRRRPRQVWPRVGEAVACLLHACGHLTLAVRAVVAWFLGSFTLGPITFLVLHKCVGGLFPCPLPR